MSTLHTVNKSPYERNALKSCLDHLCAGDLVLLIEDGVLAARRGGAFAQAINAAKGNCKFYALGPDLAARGIASGDVIEGVETVDYAGFVDLAADATRVCAWL
ncbi:sulfurtransferase complex subunit TusB [Rhodoblastus acidophilus]|uniref:Sulfurtransferase complex subunit TusB n=1 Tax=Candidatus Rhodoblastus alkanivorans TaxID=2954117 RepID=A0ABS9Z8R8_9HYPH|nr:sulfurtransferase complex subunit TusB [Candidatus Rhodoblastus alkanivorans]MCI4680329.1 sulfurtransferase complex subunit TusB [Candidatus Rhodoblastus alkanivorans]MCI4684018.1 sulfurtransferase complex subunit TusB [Candidatus Rhodoblastus alkanivorans]MDI4641337.1 sulfurtransferase complex subunit TusB [Rhodoblastus acidophilus]